MRLPILFCACIMSFALFSCHKEYRCDCEGFNSKQQRIDTSKEFKLAEKKDAKRLCDSLHLQFKQVYPDLTDDDCSLN